MTATQQQTEMQRLDARYDAARSAQRDAEAQRRKLEDDRLRVQAAIKTATDAAALADLQGRESALATLCDRARDDVSAKAVAVQAVANERQNLREQIKGLIAKLDKADTIRAAYRQKRQQAEADLQMAQREIAKVENDLAAFNTECESVAAAIRSLGG